VVRVYFPPDANTLLWIGDHCLKTWDRVNVIVAGKQPEPQWLAMENAIRHCEAGLGIWDWAGAEDGLEPDILIACAGDVPKMETLAAVDLLRQSLPHLRTRVVNVVDLMILQSPQHHPHGISDEDFDQIFKTTVRSSSHITAILISFIGSFITGPTTQTSMCEASSKRDQQQRLSIWRFSTNWIAFI